MSTEREATDLETEQRSQRSLRRSATPAYGRPRRTGTAGNASTIRAKACSRFSSCLSSPPREARVAEPCSFPPLPSLLRF